MIKAPNGRFITDFLPSEFIEAAEENKSYWNEIENWDLNEIDGYQILNKEILDYDDYNGVIKIKTTISKDNDVRVLKFNLGKFSTIYDLYVVYENGKIIYKRLF